VLLSRILPNYLFFQIYTSILILQNSFFICIFLIFSLMMAYLSRNMLSEITMIVLKIIIIIICEKEENCPIFINLYYCLVVFIYSSVISSFSNHNCTTGIFSSKLPLRTTSCLQSTLACPRQCPRAVTIPHVRCGPSNLPNNNHSHICRRYSRPSHGQWSRRSLPETSNSSTRNPNLDPKMANAGQRPQIGPRNVHHTQRHVPSRPYEQCATSLRGPC
jgi:hypothetical protein